MITILDDKILVFDNDDSGDDMTVMNVNMLFGGE